ncbi:conserved Plasmodium protein, unknown function [Plasmodium ovale]|uniref:Uncharacterized protein n=1 Tax=Plasmodium ovale TaxID=36330 RepID=A0A1C3KXI5_PLAOA|nr:conserved Plasmodium protein, unknown function [Plasmodium ovale]SCP06278.1 conserved Plasmodium protein, unknown function [Plasmodium ovale]
MESLKFFFIELLKKKKEILHLSNLSVLINDPFIFFFMCIFLFVLTSIVTYLYCFCKSYEWKRGTKVYKMSRKVK